MSAAEPPSPTEIEQEFPITADQAQIIADGLSPLQDITDAGASIGQSAEAIPGPGPKLVGVVLQNLSTHVELASVSVETLARVMEFYVEAQAGSFQDLFPPPQVAIEQFGRDFDPVVQSLSNPGQLPE